MDAVNAQEKRVIFSRAPDVDPRVLRGSSIVASVIVERSRARARRRRVERQSLSRIQRREFARTRRSERVGVELRESFERRDEPGERVRGAFVRVSFSRERRRRHGVDVETTLAGEDDDSRRLARRFFGDVLERTNHRRRRRRRRLVRARRAFADVEPSRDETRDGADGGMIEEQRRRRVDGEPRPDRRREIDRAQTVQSVLHERRVVVDRRSQRARDDGRRRRLDVVERRRGRRRRLRDGTRRRLRRRRVPNGGIETRSIDAAADEFAHKRAMQMPRAQRERFQIERGDAHDGARETRLERARASRGTHAADAHPR